MMASAGRMRWLPGSLFGQLVLVLGAGLLMAQLLSAAINVAERDRLVSGNYGLQPAQRIADMVSLLDGLGESERERVVAVFNQPPLVLSLHDQPLVPTAAAQGWRAGVFAARLQAALGDDRPVRVEAREGFAGLPTSLPPGGMTTQHEAMHGPGTGMMGRGRGGGMMAGALAVLRTEVQLRDGRWARFDAELPAAPDALPWRLVLTLGVLLAAVLLLSYVAVRWVVRPLHVLARAADALGQDLERAPLPEDGPLEVRQAARAFNTMQRRLAGFINDRTRVLTALSHDLKTPLTRLRLRAELLDDDEQRERFEADLREMETMVLQTLEFMRGLGHNAPRVPVDVNALLATLQADNAAMGRTLHTEGHATAPYVAAASLLKRALGNLVDNACAYGGGATVTVQDTAERLELQVLDNGPGIPESQLEQVFEPFFRLEASRSRATGGTGLGLGIARNIARSHGGDLVLRNRPGGGLAAVLTLPRRRTESL
jgi:signal transduction histidine kinase